MLITPNSLSLIFNAQMQSVHNKRIVFYIQDLYCIPTIVNLSPSHTLVIPNISPKSVQDFLSYPVHRHADIPQAVPFKALCNRSKQIQITLSHPCWIHAIYPQATNNIGFHTEKTAISYNQQFHQNISTHNRHLK